MTKHKPNLLQKSLADSVSLPGFVGFVEMKTNDGSDLGSLAAAEGLVVDVYISVVCGKWCV